MGSTKRDTSSQLDKTLSLDGVLTQVDLDKEGDAFIEARLEDFQVYRTVVEGCRQGGITNRVPSVVLRLYDTTYILTQSLADDIGRQLQKAANLSEVF